MFLGCGRGPECSDGTRASTGRTCKLRTERPQKSFRVFEPGTFSGAAGQPFHTVLISPHWQPYLWCGACWDVQCRAVLTSSLFSRKKSLSEVGVKCVSATVKLITMSFSSGYSRPISAIAWASNSSTCPSHFTMIAATEDGAVANFTRGFGLKSGYFLSYSKDLSGGMVVSDVQVISDKDVIPHGYCYIPEFMESKSSVWKKKRVCVRIVPVDSVTTVVLDIRVTAKSKSVLQQYTCLGDILGYVLWCLKGPFSSPVPQTKPRSLSVDMRQLSLEAGTPMPLGPNNQPSQAPPRISRRRGTLDRTVTTEKVHDGCSIYGITAMDGVPFALHPKFESRAIEKVSTSALDNILIKSLQDIENEYNYTFAIEEQAVKRP